MLFHFNGEHGAVGLHAFFQLGHLLKIRQTLILVVVVVVVWEADGRLFELAGVVYIEALVLEEFDDGVFGQVQLCRERVYGLLVRIQTHVLDEALQDPQGLHGDAVGLAALAAGFVLCLGGGGGGGLSRGETRIRLLLLLLEGLKRLLGQERLGRVRKGQRNLELRGRLLMSLERGGEKIIQGEC